MRQTHVSCTEYLHECKVTASLDLAKLLAIIELQVLHRGLIEALLTWPFKSLSPSLVTEPVA